MDSVQHTMNLHAGNCKIQVNDALNYTLKCILQQQGKTSEFFLCVAWGEKTEQD